MNFSCSSFAQLKAIMRATLTSHLHRYFSSTSYGIFEVRRLAWEGQIVSMGARLVTCRRAAMKWFMNFGIFIDHYILWLVFLTSKLSPNLYIRRILFCDCFVVFFFCIIHLEMISTSHNSQFLHCLVVMEYTRVIFPIQWTVQFSGERQPSTMRCCAMGWIEFVWHPHCAPSN